MKPTRIIIFLLLVSSCSNKRPIKNDLFYDQLTGKVSKATMSFYEPVEKNGGALKGNIRSRYIFDFNDDGNIKQQTEIAFSTNGALTKTQTLFTFNNKGQHFSARHLLKTVPYIYCSYDDEGRLTETRKYDDEKDTLMSKTTFIHYSDKSSEQDDYNSSGQLLNKTLFRGSNDMVTEIRKYDNKGALIIRTLFSYDNHGRMLKMKDIEYKNTAEFTYKYLDFDEQGNYRTCISYYNGKATQIEERSLLY